MRYVFDAVCLGLYSINSTPVDIINFKRGGAKLMIISYENDKNEHTLQNAP